MREITRSNQHGLTPPPRGRLPKPPLTTIAGVLSLSSASQRDPRPFPRPQPRRRPQRAPALANPRFQRPRAPKIRPFPLFTPQSPVITTVVFIRDSYSLPWRRRAYARSRSFPSLLPSSARLSQSTAGEVNQDDPEVEQQQAQFGSCDVQQLSERRPSVLQPYGCTVLVNAICSTERDNRCLPQYCWYPTMWLLSRLSALPTDHQISIA
jgi:hypothetical protein